MSNDVEKAIVRKLLVSRYGHELVASEAELAFPNELNASVGDLWEPAFGRLSALYGRQVGTARRTGKDLTRYSRQKGVLAQTLYFDNLQPLSAIAPVRNSSVWQRLVFQEFPREHLYRLEGEAVCVEFDDWPGQWIRNWNTLIKARSSQGDESVEEDDGFAPIDGGSSFDRTR